MNPRRVEIQGGVASMPKEPECIYFPLSAKQSSAMRRRFYWWVAAHTLSVLVFAGLVLWDLGTNHVTRSYWWFVLVGVAALGLVYRVNEGPR